MSSCCSCQVSTIAKKVVMALSGLILVGFVAAHMVGNLKIFQGIDPLSGKYKIDIYGEFLREMGYPMFGHGQALWIARGVLLVAVLLHVWSAISLTLLARRARPVGYASYVRESSTYAARTMRWGGVIILFYVIYHIMHLTLGQVHSDKFIEGSVYSNVYRSFSLWEISAVYLVAMTALCFHLYHGIWSMFQTLGINGPKLTPALKNMAKVVAIVIFLGYISVPVAVLAGKLPQPIEQTSRVQGYEAKL